MKPLLLALLLLSVPVMSEECFDGTKWRNDKGIVIEFTDKIIIWERG